MSDADAKRKLNDFLDAGVRAFIDLTDPADRLTPYAPALKSLAEERGVAVTYERLTIRDMDVCGAGHMNHVLDTIDAKIDGGEGAYVHCWGGIGRTGTVVGCWLVRHGRTGEEALREVNSLFETMSPKKVSAHRSWGSPQTDAQRAMVRDWAKHDRAATFGALSGTRTREPAGAAVSDEIWSLLSPRLDASPRLRDQMRGALIGLAVGDAVGTTVEFKQRGSFAPVTDMVGGGPFSLAPGQWTDDTSMALSLAESLCERRAFDARDQMQRYVRWWREGYLSSTDRCFDIGNTVRQALRAFEKTGDPMSGPTGEMTAGNGSLMRLAPVPIFFFGRREDAIAAAGESSRTTHGAPVAIDACRYFAALLTGAFRGASKAELLSPHYSPEPGYWDAHPLHPVISAVAAGSFKEKPASAIRGSAYSAEALEAALWAFHSSNDFREGCLLAVNLGDDADTTAAIFGQLAGALYGESAIPSEWRAKLARKPVLDRSAEMLFQLAFGGPRPLGPRTANAQAEAERLLAEAGGDAAVAMRQFNESEERQKQEAGALAYHMNGSMAEQVMRDEILLQLRVALGVSVAEGKGG